MEEIKKKYLLYCKNLNDCSTKKKVKQHNAAMKHLSKLFHTIQNEPNKSFLLELLDNNDDKTRILVAAHCIGLGVYISEAEKVLEEIAKSNVPMLAFEAQATLDVWRTQGYLHF